MLQFKTGESLTGRKFKLDWTIPNKDQYAQIQFLEIQFTRSQGQKDDNDGCVSAYVKENFIQLLKETKLYYLSDEVFF